LRIKIIGQYVNVYYQRLLACVGIFIINEFIEVNFYFCGVYGISAVANSVVVKPCKVLCGLCGFGIRTKLAIPIAW